jgi:shikimate dehydrogenase
MKPIPRGLSTAEANMQYPNINTKLFFLLGTPLGHSVSPPMHNCVFEKLGLDHIYLPVEVEADNLERTFKGLTCMNVQGFNVTIPHKIRIMDLLDDLDPLAKTIGAVNTICIQDGKTIGFNTDGEDFIRSLKEETGLDCQGKRFFLLGSGGAARAISMTLADQGAERVFLCNRTVEKAEALASEINRKIRNCAQIVLPEIARQREVIENCDALVNCTSLGMHPKDDILPIDESLIDSHLVVVDIVYNPLITKLLRVAESKGCQICRGLGMLIYQGAAAFKLWTGREPLVSEMSKMAYSIMQSRL